MVFLSAGVFLARRYLAVIFRCSNVRVCGICLGVGGGGVRRQEKFHLSTFSSPGRLWAALIWEYFSILKERRRVGDEFPNCLLVQTDARPPGGDTRAAPRPQLLGVTLAPPASQPCGSRASSTCRGRPESAARPLPLRPPPPAPPCWVRRAPPGPSVPLLAQPPPKPGEVESCRRCSLRGPRGAALGMLSRRSQCCSK